MSLEDLQHYRDERGLLLYYEGMVKPKGILISVQSESNSGVEYDVLVDDSGAFSCNCPDFEERGDYLQCKHISASKFYLQKGKRD